MCRGQPRRALLVRRQLGEIRGGTLRQTEGPVDHHRRDSPEDREGHLCQSLGLRHEEALGNRLCRRPPVDEAECALPCGRVDPADPRLATCSSLYAYAISYDCTGISCCLAIPAPTAANPVGLAPGSPFFVMGRKYLEPRTGVRPALSEITPHRSMLLSTPSARSGRASKLLSKPKSIRSASTQACA